MHCFLPLHPSHFTPVVLPSLDLCARLFLMLTFFFLNASVFLQLSSSLNMARRNGRLSRQGTSEEIPELKEVAGEVTSQIPVVAVEDVDGDVGDVDEDTGSKRKTAQETAAERERAAQRQVMAIEELVDTERNYLKHLELCTNTIRSNLQKLQVGVLLTFIVRGHQHRQIGQSVCIKILDLNVILFLLHIKTNICK